MDNYNLNNMSEHMHNQNEEDPIKIMQDAQLSSEQGTYKVIPPDNLSAFERYAPPEIKEASGPNEGLGIEKNQQIAEYLEQGNYNGLLDIINLSEDKDMACEVVTHSMFNFHQEDRADSTDSLVRVALGDVDRYGDVLKSLILYSWKNNLKGERFWKNPSKDEILFLDDDGELISFEGEIGTHLQGDVKGMNYIKDLNKYEVLTGPNKGRTFDGSYEASKTGGPTYRPIKGPETV